MSDDFFYEYSKNKEVYNNEVFAALSIYSIIKEMKHMKLSKALLIMPFVAHKQTMKFLKNDNTVINSIEELIVKKPDFFTNFNDRYYSLLTISLNSIMLLIELKVISINDSQLFINEMKSIMVTKQNCGKRIFEVMKGSEKISKLLNGAVDNLYLQLRVEL